MTATEGFEKVKHLIDQGCDKVVVCNGGHYYAIEYGGVVCDSSCLLAVVRNLQAEVGQLCVEYKDPSMLTLKIVSTPMLSDMLVMSISGKDETILINVKDRAD
jgi:hypothetical protein